MIVDDTVSPAAQVATGRPDLRKLFAPVARDILVPIAAYFVLHALGCSDFMALLAGALASAATVLVEVARNRRIDLFAGMVLGGFVIGLIGSLLSGDARTLMVQQSVVTAGIGVTILIGLFFGKPLTYYAARRVMATGDLAVIEHTYRTNGLARRTHVRLSALWGVGLVVEAATRIVLVYRLSVPTMAWLSTVLMTATLTVLVVVTVRMVERMRKALRG
ncbi:VC0807 family protein [Nocardia sp. SC052]|uniref:VC0807 family protein n=1 Tax=Nocardia sichangensis TaxID=3385975 RepID=UPI0039A30362